MKKSISCLVILTVLSSTPMAANPELSTDALEHVVFELTETLSELWANKNVRTSAMVAGIAAGMAYLYYRSPGSEESSTSAARTRYAGLMQRKLEAGEKREKEERALNTMRAHLGIIQDEQEVYAYPGAVPQTRGVLGDKLTQLLPQLIVQEDKEVDQDGVTVSSSHLQGAAVGVTAGVLLMLLYYGKPLKNGIVLEKLRSIVPTGLVDAAESVPIIGWPVTVARTILSAL